MLDLTRVGRELSCFALLASPAGTLLLFDLIEDLVFLLVSVLDQIVDSLDQVTEGLLLLCKLLLNSVEIGHQRSELRVFHRVVELLARVEHGELLLELFLGTGLVLFRPVDCHEV